MTKLVKKIPLLTVVLGDFHTKTQTCCKSDKTSNEGSKLDVLTCSHGLHQLINEQAHLFDSS